MKLNLVVLTVIKSTFLKQSIECLFKICTTLIKVNERMMLKLDLVISVIL